MENLASIIIVTYNHRKYLDACIGSIEQQGYPHEIIVVDNGSTDDTCEYIESTYPDIKLIRNRNTGYGAGNNLGVKHSKGQYLIILNPDTILEKNCVSTLIEPLLAESNVITNPKILLYEGSSINTCGNTSHYTGLSFTQGLGEPATHYSTPFVLTGISGACFAIKRDDYVSLGGFDEHFFLYGEDVDLSWKAHAQDYKLQFIPDAIVYHDYMLEVSPKKLYFLEMGRYLLLRKYLRSRDLFCIAPALLMTEILVTGYAITLGRNGLGSLVRAKKDTLKPGVVKNNPDYKKIFSNLSSRIPEDQLNVNRIDRVIKIIGNCIFQCNYRLARRFFYK